MAKGSFSISPDVTMKFEGEADLKEGANNLKKFVRFLHGIISVKLNHETKMAIKYAIRDVHASYKMLVDTLTPFELIDNDEFFKSNFKKKYKQFVSVKYKNSSIKEMVLLFSHAIDKRVIGGW